MMIRVITVSWMSSHEDHHLSGRRRFRAIDRELIYRGTPHVLLATPPPLTVRDEHMFLTPTTTMVVLWLLLVLAGLVRVALVVVTMSTGTTSKRTKTEFVDFFLLFSLFGACCQRGIKLEGSTTI
jgi:hypothetical protein